MRFPRSRCPGYVLVLSVLVSMSQLSASPQQSSDVFSEPIPSLGSGRPFYPDESSLQNSQYQIGEQWGKQSVSQTDFDTVPSLRGITYATANVRGATGFYLGEFAGHHLALTNNHVCSSNRACAGSQARFDFADLKVRIDEVLGTWPSIDSALLLLKPTATQAPLLSQLAIPIDFSSELKKGQKLITVGYGSANNPWRRLVGNWDSDCRVFSANGDYRLMRDPDQYNPGPYETWSFANGCDVSHGDSGSAMVDRNTGSIIGIIWTGKVPKSNQVQDGDRLDEIYLEDSELIWTELSYAVPGSKIRQQIEDALNEQAFRPDIEDSIRELIIQSQAQ